MKESIIINCPATLIHGHQTLIKMLEADTTLELSSLVFMGAASPIAAAKQGIQGYSDSMRSKLAALTHAYIKLAHIHQAKLLVCGKAARSRGLKELTDLASGFEFTGYMEILTMLRRMDEKVIIW